MSTEAHPQTDGQTERMNQTLEQYLRSFVNHDQDNWSELLHFAEMAMNGAISSSTKRTPFEINYGFNPRFDFLADQVVETVPATDIFIGKLRSIWIETIQNLKNTISFFMTYSGRFFGIRQTLPGGINKICIWWSMSLLIYRRN